jgi:hypothetical protein
MVRAMLICGLGLMLLRFTSTLRICSPRRVYDGTKIAWFVTRRSSGYPWWHREARCIPVCVGGRRTVLENNASPLVPQKIGYYSTQKRLRLSSTVLGLNLLLFLQSFSHPVNQVVMFLCSKQLSFVVGASLLFIGTENDSQIYRIQ